MMPLARWLACLGLVAGCGRDAGTAAPQVSAAYRADIENLCDVIARSGAEQLAETERTLTTANWLAAHLQTQEARDYLVRIQPLVGDAKAAALEAEAKRAGLPHCALADTWRAAAGR